MGATVWITCRTRFLDVESPLKSGGVGCISTVALRPIGRGNRGGNQKSWSRIKSKVKVIGIAFCFQISIIIDGVITSCTATGGIGNGYIICCRAQAVDYGIS